MATTNTTCSCSAIDGTDSCELVGKCEDFCATQAAYILSVNALVPKCTGPFDQSCGEGKRGVLPSAAQVCMLTCCDWLCRMLDYLCILGRPLFDRPCCLPLPPQGSPARPTRSANSSAVQLAPASPPRPALGCAHLPSAPLLEPSWTTVAQASQLASTHGGLLPVSHAHSCLILPPAESWALQACAVLKATHSVFCFPETQQSCQATHWSCLGPKRHCVMLSSTRSSPHQQALWF